MKYSKDVNRFSLINRRNLRYRDYTQTLITEAMRVDLVSMREIDDWQMQIMGQLEVLMKRAKDAGIAVDDACGRELLNGIYFTVDTDLLSFHDPMYALSALQSESISSIYASGQRQIRAHYLQTVNLYVRTKTVAHPVPNPSYDVTMQSEIQAALLLHDPLFPARTGPVFSYPLSDRRVCDHKGIFYPKCYLEALSVERQFVSMFSEREKARFFEGRQIEGNLFFCLLSRSLCAAMLGKFPGTLNLENDEIERLCDRFSRRSLRELNEMTMSASDVICHDFRIISPALAVAVRRGAKEWAKLICVHKSSATLRRDLFPGVPAQTAAGPENENTEASAAGSLS